MVIGWSPTWRYCHLLWKFKENREIGFSNWKTGVFIKISWILVKKLQDIWGCHCSMKVTYFRKAWKRAAAGLKIYGEVLSCHPGRRSAYDNRALHVFNPPEMIWLLYCNRNEPSSVSNRLTRFALRSMLLQDKPDLFSRWSEKSKMARSKRQGFEKIETWIKTSEILEQIGRYRFFGHFSAIRHFSLAQGPVTSRPTHEAVQAANADVAKAFMGTRTARGWICWGSLRWFKESHLFWLWSWVEVNIAILFRAVFFLVFDCMYWMLLSSVLMASAPWPFCFSRKMTWKEEDLKRAHDSSYISTVFFSGRAWKSELPMTASEDH